MDGTPGSRADEVYTSLESGSQGEDCNGHGTHVAASVGGLTYGPAKGALLHAVRSLECLGNGTVSQVLPQSWAELFGGLCVVSSAAQSGAAGAACVSCALPHMRLPRGPAARCTVLRVLGQWHGVQSAAVELR